MAGAVIMASPQVRAELHVTSFRAELLARTIGYNGLAAVIATLMGLPAAFVLGRGRGWIAKAMWVILPAALLMPSLAYAYGWAQFVRLVRVALANHYGTPFLQKYGLTFPPGGVADTLRCIWSLAAWLWAVPAALIGLALRRMDTTLQQQALMDGALRRVTLRQLLGPIIASVCVVTVLATQEFAVYEPTGISVVATEMRMVFDTGSLSSINNPITVPGLIGAGVKSPDQPARAAAAVATCGPLIAITTLLAAIGVWGASRSSVNETLTVGDWPRSLDTSGWTVAVTVGLLLLNIGIPVVSLLASLTVPLSPRNIYDEFAPQLWGAMLVATEAAAVALVVSFFAAARWVPGLLAAAGASFLIGGQLLAISLIRSYNRRTLAVDNWVYDTSVIAVIAYLGRYGWLAVAAGRGAWTRPWRELRDMANLDGANDLWAAVSVIWPLAWPVLLAGGLLVGALSLTEVPATVLLFPQHPQVLTPTLMTWLHMAHYNSMIEASLLMMASVAVPAVAAVLLTSFGLRITRRHFRHGTSASS
jgi:ABC-type Fe3+ transport system permease subunit